MLNPGCCLLRPERLQKVARCALPFSTSRYSDAPRKTCRRNLPQFLRIAVTESTVMAELTSGLMILYHFACAVFPSTSTSLLTQHIAIRSGNARLQIPKFTLDCAGETSVRQRVSRRVSTGDSDIAGRAQYARSARCTWVFLLSLLWFFCQEIVYLSLATIEMSFRR